MKSVAFISILLGSLTTTGCAVSVGNSGVRGSGVTAKETQSLDSFSTLRFSGAATVRVHLSDESSVTISADDNLLPLIETRVEGDSLVIRPTESIRPQSPLIIDVHTTQLTEVRLSGASKLELAEFAGEAIEIHASGASKIEGSGVVESLKLTMSGAGTVNLKELQTTDLSISLTGASRAVVHANRSISAKLTGASSVTCHGNPSEVTKSLTGASRLSIEP